MRVLSWIFQPVYLLFLLILVVFYLYREEVMPEHRNVEQSRSLIERMEQSVAAIEAHGVALNSAAPGAGVANATNEPPQQIILETELRQPLNSTRPVVVKRPPVEEVTDDRVPTEEPSADVVESTAPESEPTNPSGPLEAVVVVGSTETATPIESVEAPGDEIPKSLGRLWYAARAAAWSGRYEQAVAHYLQLTSNYPESADGFGELGNLYYAGGDIEAALGAYQQALNIYQSAGSTGQALYLQRVIAGIQQHRTRR